jgi:PAS domain S-box-containing protein
MKKDKTKEQLVDELGNLRQRIIELEQLVNTLKLNEKKIKESKELYKNIVETAPDGIVTTDLKGVITSFNPSLLEQTGYSGEDFIGRHFTKIPIVRAKDIQKYVKALNSLIRGKIPKPFEHEWMDKAGNSFIGEVYVSPIKKNGKTIGFQAITRDITERKKAEEALQKSERQYRTIVQTAPDVILSINSKGTVTTCNDAMTGFSGYSPGEIVGKHFSQLPFLVVKEIPRYLEIFASLLKRKIPKPIEVQYVHKDGTLRWTEIHVGLLEGEGKISGIQVVGRDISERKREEEEKERLQAQLIQSEKMAGVGTLTSGIAHEFNNLLQIMMGHAEFAQQTKRIEDMEEAIDLIVKTSERVAKIIEDLLAFSKTDVSEVKQHDIPEILESVFSLIENQLRKRNVNVLRKYHMTPPVEANKEEIQQVFLNIVTNARDAMLPEGGMLEVEVKRHKKNVDISFRDSGKGIKKEDLDKVFEPFYTTKGAVGRDSKLQGTGLGLTVSYGIVKRHGGTMKVASEVDKGTTFTITLPIKQG